MSTVQIESSPTMTPRCHFDPSQVPAGVFSYFPCPECGMVIVSGLPHPVPYVEDIEKDHAIVEWNEGTKDND